MLMTEQEAKERLDWIRLCVLGSEEDADLLINAVRMHDAAILRGWSKTFGSGPSGEAVRSIANEAANMLDPNMQNVQGVWEEV